MQKIQSVLKIPPKKAKTKADLKTNENENPTLTTIEPATSHIQTQQQYPNKHSHFFLVTTYFSDFFCYLSVCVC